MEYDIYEVKGFGDVKELLPIILKTLKKGRLHFGNKMNNLLKENVDSPNLVFGPPSSCSKISPGDLLFTSEASFAIYDHDAIIYNPLVPLKYCAYSVKSSFPLFLQYETIRHYLHEYAHYLLSKMIPKHFAKGYNFNFTSSEEGLKSLIIFSRNESLADNIAHRCTRDFSDSKNMEELKEKQLFDIISSYNSKNESPAYRFISNEIILKNYYYKNFQEVSDTELRQHILNTNWDDVTINDKIEALTILEMYIAPYKNQKWC